MRAVDRDTWTRSCSSFNRASDPWPRNDPRPFAQILLDDEFRCGFQSDPRTRSTVLKESIMTATYAFDVFSSLDGFGSHSGNWAATGASKAPSCSTTASVNTYCARQCGRP